MDVINILIFITITVLLIGSGIQSVMLMQTRGKLEKLLKEQNQQSSYKNAGCSKE